RRLGPPVPRRPPRRLALLHLRRAGSPPRRPLLGGGLLRRGLARRDGGHERARRRHQPPPRGWPQSGPLPRSRSGRRLRHARGRQDGHRPPRHPQPGQAGAALTVRWSGMALTRPSLEARTVGGAAMAILVVALPAVLTIEAVKGDDLAGEESSIWALGALA